MNPPSSANRLLLDTHTLVWYADHSAQLPAATRALLDDADSALFVSVVSFWELATLTNLRRLLLKPDLGGWIDQIRRGKADFLSIADSHLLTYATLPQVKDHRDPFDRLLIAQALTENLTLISRDAMFASYPVKVQW